MPETTSRVGVIVVAGGSGERFAAPGGKQMARVAGRPLLAHTVEALRAAKNVTDFVVVTHPARVDEYREALGARGDLRFVPGGVARQDSVRAGLAAMPAEIEVIAVHDGARPLVTPEILDAAVVRLAGDAALDGVVVGHPAFDTMKAVEGETVTGTVDRSRLWHAQTPQVFRARALRAAYERGGSEAAAATDDAQLVEMAGGTVEMLAGPRHNVKVTVPEDLALVAALLGGKGDDMGLRVGLGFDMHAFVPGRPLVLGGVVLDHEMGLAGHSDADVLAHALMDAILGAMRAGDIGQHFPDSDDAYFGVSSMELMRRVGELMAAEGYELVDADCVLAMERPKVSPHRDAMRLAMAEALAVDADRIGLKATTTEGLGAVGREEGASAQAVVLLRRVAG